MNKAILLSKNVKEELGVNENEIEAEIQPTYPDLTNEQRLLKLFQNSKYHILPSFFKTLIYLKKQKREFSIVLRSEEDYMENVIFEFNQFCSGTHPCYNGKAGTPTLKFDGSKGN